MNLLDNFKIAREKEDFQVVVQNILNGIEFKGTNLWVLIFAIFIASLGLNVNSTAVIIGAMLVSPLMGPIIGLGFGMAINDLLLLKKAFFSYLFSIIVCLITSTFFFLISPINEAHSEILSRTSPNIYDVMIALFGGLAGNLAITSKLKGNVIPGVAIATALMPPLCTAGYGLATFQFQFFFGAFYLFIINSVFIALATFITARFLKFPFKRMPEKKDETKAKRVVWGVVIITILPSIYFGYDMIEQNKFEESANLFIETEAIFPNDYLLKKSIDSKEKEIILIYGGQLIQEKEIKNLKNKLKKYKLENANLEIQQGFAYLKDNKDNKETKQLSIAFSKNEKIINKFQKEKDSLKAIKNVHQEIFKELHVQYPNINSCIIQNATQIRDTSNLNICIVIVEYKNKLNKMDEIRIENWLRVRLKFEKIKIYFEK